MTWSTEELSEAAEWLEDATWTPYSREHERRGLRDLAYREERILEYARDVRMAGGLAVGTGAEQRTADLDLTKGEWHDAAHWPFDEDERRRAKPYGLFCYEDEPWIV